ncbi:MAG: DUF1902 domain-containing protein [Planctomycetes bacterium]|nr:DUF1902 domain-containing protein [Planctomycetota bacterium]
MTLAQEFSVTLFWDDESSTWVATSEDIPGLVLGSDSVDDLINRVRSAAPEIMELNKITAEKVTLRFQYHPCSQCQSLRQRRVE